MQLTSSPSSVPHRDRLGHSTSTTTSTNKRSTTSSSLVIDRKRDNFTGQKATPIVQKFLHVIIVIRSIAAVRHRMSCWTRRRRRRWRRQRGHVAHAAMNFITHCTIRYEWKGRHGGEPVEFEVTVGVGLLSRRHEGRLTSGCASCLYRCTGWFLIKEVEKEGDHGFTIFEEGDSSQFLGQFEKPFRLDGTILMDQVEFELFY